MVIKFGEHEPLVQKAEVEREYVECQCGERLWVDEKYPIPDGMIGGKEHTNERTIRCKECGRVYAPISDFRTGWDSCYILLGLPCAWCDGYTNHPLKLRPEDDEPSVCRKCVEKELERRPKNIIEKERALAFFREQLGEDAEGSNGIATKIIDALEEEFRKRGMFGVVHSAAPELEQVINAIIRGED